ncbi:signal recognition particle protein [Candidatus Odyssella thessalonicensis]|uniref:signal recognition particle protein n=1 Tax=Candidatus Odyssella thessalonicensis TaxID=84647 RepID=UPI000225A8A2|nr:signal recognition particle protein [Candidatus Odyssella thessalonicensis]
MFQSLSKRLTGVLDKLRGRGALTEADVTAALREVRIALLEADVALPVVKQFIEGVREKAIGQDVIKSVTPGQMVVKIVNDHLIEMLGAKAEDINLAVSPPAVILMVGLQGSGKTTSTGKLAKYLKEKLNKKVLMASLDIYRPAAQLQLETLGNQLSVQTLPIVAEEKPLAITRRALKSAKEQGVDVLILDTAGRLHIDQELMDEVVAIRQASAPIETFLVADAMTGQDAVTIAKEFNEKVGITGIILTRLDGDARGGAALSMRSVTGCPIKFMGMGEKLDQLEPFHPERIASRILDMGDIVSLVERASEIVDQEEAERLAKKMQKGAFDLNDMEKQLESMIKMGGFGGIMSMLPGVGKIKDKMDEMGVDDTILKRQIAIIRSMTKKERRDPKVLNGSRRKRIAAGSGTQVQDVNRLLKQFEQMQSMMKRLGKLGKSGLMRGGLKGLFGR